MHFKFFRSGENPIFFPVNMSDEIHFWCFCKLMGNGDYCLMWFLNNYTGFYIQYEYYNLFWLNCTSKSCRSHFILAFPCGCTGVMLGDVLFWVWVGVYFPCIWNLPLLSDGCWAPESQPSTQIYRPCWVFARSLFVFPERRSPNKDTSCRGMIFNHMRGKTERKIIYLIPY